MNLIRAFQHSTRGRRKEWGLFLPLHAMHSRRSWGAGDLTDFSSWIRWMGRRGASVAAVLPLFPTFLDRPYDPSPYSPVSRLFWSEFWIDIERSPDLARSPKARGMLKSPSFRRAVQCFRRSSEVDYRGIFRWKWRFLRELSETFFRTGSPGRRAAFDLFRRGKLEVERYARFRARQAGRPEESRVWVYAQWLVTEQMEAVARTAVRAGVRLYTDLPIGVHPRGYDAYRDRGLFVKGQSVGAPPDPFFRGGQNWGFAPLNPVKIRQEGFRYFRECLRQAMRFSGFVRIDHVMGLYRLFWVPKGRPAAQGVYVRYPWEEMLTVLCLESRRSRCEVVGEDLGTVPEEVRRGMKRRGIRRMFVGQFELRPGRFPRLNPAPADSVASLNTHDMPPFAAFWRRERQRGRLGETLAVHRALLEQLARGPARLLMISAEDLWGETRPQNVPGTGPQTGNWRRKSCYSLEAIWRRLDLLETLKKIDHLRKKREMRKKRGKRRRDKR